MLDDEHGWQGEVPLPRPPSLPSSPGGPRFIAPVPLGRPAWERRYTRSALTVDALAVGCSPVSYLLWRNAVPLPLVMAVLTGVALALVGRAAMWARLVHSRRRGRAMSEILVLGTENDVVDLVARTRRNPALGWRVKAACTSSGTGPNGASTVAGVPVLGDLDSVASIALTSGFHAVAACPTPGWTPIRLQQLAWDLDGSRTALLVDRRLVMQADPAVRASGVAGLPLLHLMQPTLQGRRRLAKGATDRLVALLVLLLVAPVLLSCAIAVRRDGGPALERRTRVGRNGRAFSMLGFRTTTVDGARMTPVGRILRERCLDELPQLLNVLGGSMALVGPRPTTPNELAEHSRASRPMVVKPGITGLWQVDDDELPVDERASLHLRYAETWTPALDARILVRTMKTALNRRASL
jgi:lipopolysaccharide/colanic/teichoic acid biosynthesis glycosyltransferase